MSPQRRRRRSTPTPNPPNYNALLCLQMVLGIWPGTSVGLGAVNAGLVWCTLVACTATEIVLLVQHSLHRAVIEVLLKGAVLLAALGFSAKYFGRDHGFEYLVALVRRTFHNGPDKLRTRTRSAFRILSLVHMILLAVVVAVVAVVDIEAFDDKLKSVVPGHVPAGVVVTVKVGLVLRTLFMATFLMFFSLTCCLHSMLARYLLDVLCTAPEDLAPVYRLHANILVSLRATSSSFSAVLALLLVQSTVQFLYLTWDSLSTTRGVGYVIVDMLLQTMAIYIVTALPAATTMACARVAYEANSIHAATAPLLGQAALDYHSTGAPSPNPAAVAGSPGSPPGVAGGVPSGPAQPLLPLLAHHSNPSPLRSSHVLSPDWQSHLAALVAYMSRSDFYVSVVGVPMTPTVAAPIAYLYTVWAILAVWMSLTAHDPSL